MSSLNDAWAQLDDAVLGAFRDGRARSTRDVYRMLPDLAHREVVKSLEVNTQRGLLAAGESTFQITEVGARHLAANTKAMA